MTLTKIMTAGFMFSGAAFAFEKAAVLPKGVRNLTIKSVTTSISEKTDQTGKVEPISKPLQQNLTFQKVVNGESGSKKIMLEAFLLDHFELDDSLGSFSADMKGNVSVTAAVLSYGLTDRLTLAAALPYYKAKMSIDVGFQPTQKAQDFVNRLHHEDFNQTQAAQDAGNKVNNAVGELNKKLEKNGYSRLADWEGSGIGDTTLAAKYMVVDSSLLKVATLTGVLAPTGRINDPDNMIDIPFSDGVWNAFASAIFDQPITSDFFFNEFFKYSYQAPTKNQTRLATKQESVEVEKAETSYKLGDKIDLGVSAQYEPQFGLVAGVGYNFFQKYGDRYSVEQSETKAKLQDGTDQKASHVEFKIGYSTIPAFKRKEFAAPLTASLEYKKHVSSVNSHVKDLVTFDFALFF